MISRLDFDDVTVWLRKSKRIRYPSLKKRQSPPYGIELVIPVDSKDPKNFLPFVKKHRSWIKDHQKKLQMPIPFVDGISISVEDVLLTVRHCIQTHKTPYIDGELLVVGGEIEHLNRRVQDYLKSQAKRRLTSKIDDYCEKLGLQHNGILRIADMKTQWGSCNLGTNKITLNWRLILAPTYVFDHVVAHEAVHLRISGHGKDFYRILYSIDPNTEKSRNWLKQNGDLLLAYGFGHP